MVRAEGFQPTLERILSSPPLAIGLRAHSWFPRDESNDCAAV